MTVARILPLEEYGRLKGTDVPVLGHVRPKDLDVVVVESEGKIVAALTVVRLTHFEGAWVDPKKRGLGATRALLRLAKELARLRGDEWVMAGAEISDSRMARVLARMGAVKIPVEPYVLPVGEA